MFVRMQDPPEHDNSKLCMQFWLLDLDRSKVVCVDYLIPLNCVLIPELEHVDCRSSCSRRVSAYVSRLGLRRVDADAIIFGGIVGFAHCASSPPT